MPYIDLAGLSRFASLEKDALRREYAAMRGMPWTRTEKAGAVAFYPVGNSPLETTVDFLFTETPPASGDKSPSNPSTITGVSSVKVTRAGKNLFVPADSVSQVGTTITIAGVTLTVLPDFAYSLTGTATADALFYLRYNGGNQGLPVKSDATYTFSGCPSGGSASTYYMAWHPAIGGNVYDYGSGVTVVHPSTDATHYTFNCQIMVKAGTTVTNLVFKPQMELGSAKTEYEVPEVTDYAIQLGNTYYGGVLDVASGVMTVTFASIVIDGTTTYSSSAGVTEGTNFYRLGLYPSIARKNGAIALYSACNTLPINDGDNFIRFSNNSYKIEAQLQKSLLNLGDGESYSVVQSAFQTFFSAHPTTVVYPVSTPYTVQLTPTEILSLAQADKYTPKLNTIYTDASAVQVGYVKSPIREEFELQQAIVAQGGNV